MDEAVPPLVSIAIPVDNQGEFLAQAIDSVLAQAYPRLELIVLDDRSPDGLSGFVCRMATFSMHGEDKVSSVMEPLK